MASARLRASAVATVSESRAPATAHAALQEVLLRRDLIATWSCSAGYRLKNLAGAGVIIICFPVAFDGSSIGDFFSRGAAPRTHRAWLHVSN